MADLCGFGQKGYLLFYKPLKDGKKTLYHIVAQETMKLYTKKC